MNVEIIKNTIEYLEKHYPQNEKVKWHICEGYDCIEAPDGTRCFGCFDPMQLTIYLATDIQEPEETLIETTAHEYKHFIQMCEGKPFDEEEAETFALWIVKKLMDTPTIP